jgi:hypothetical protein
MLLDTPACSQLSLFHDSALPVNWIRQVHEEERGGVRRGMDGRIRRWWRWRGSGVGRWGMRYRDMERIDLDAARKAVCAWLDEHRDGTLAQMADDLKWRYPAYPDEMTVVLRGMMAAELRRRTRPESGSIGGRSL